MSCKVNVKPEGLTLTLQETRSIHDSMNLLTIEFIDYIYIYFKYLKYFDYF